MGSVPRERRRLTATPLTGSKPGHLRRPARAAYGIWAGSPLARLSACVARCEE